MLNLDEMPNASNSWDRLEEESNEQYSYFLHYLEMQPRDYRKLAEQEGRAYNTIKHYATIYRWKERATAWDTDRLEVRSLNRQQTISVLQDEVVKAEVLDAQEMLKVWRNSLKTMAENASASDLLKMAQTRKQIDNLLRLAAEMPSAYNPIPAQEQEEQGDYILTPDGKPNASNSSQSPRLPTENQRPSGEIQGIELWSEMGEEFPSEE